MYVNKFFHFRGHVVMSSDFSVLLGTASSRPFTAPFSNHLLDSRELVRDDGYLERRRNTKKGGRRYITVSWYDTSSRRSTTS
jgi:hypothetical protein